MSLNKRPKKTFKLVNWEAFGNSEMPRRYTDIQSVQVTGPSGLNPALVLGKEDQKCNKAFAIRKVQWQDFLEKD